MVTYQTTFLFIHILPKNQKLRFFIEINYEFYSKQIFLFQDSIAPYLVTQTNEFNQQIKPTYHVLSKYCASFVFAS